MDRIEDPALMRKYNEAGCCVCHRWPSEGHHLKTRGSWGPDVEINLIPMCRIHHQEIHAYGIEKMVSHYRRLEPVLVAKGWERQTIGSGRTAITRWFNQEVHDLVAGRTSER